MKFSEFEEFKSPSRKPWLLLVVLAVAGLLVWDRFREKPEPRYTDPTRNAPAVEESAPLPPALSRDQERPRPERSRPVQKLDVDDVYKAARAAEEDGALVAARDSFWTLLTQDLKPEMRRDVEDRLGRINVTLALTPRTMPEKVDYVVQPGDAIQKLANKFGTTVGLIQESNRISNPNRIRAGDHLRILDGNFSIKVSRSQNELFLLMDGKLFKRYLVGTGKFDKTPLGTFVVADRIKEPVWWRPDGKEVPFTGDPEGENILGTRWMSLKATGDTPDVRGYGIHGTWDEASVGKAESAGCIRLKNSDVEELYKFVPLGTPVEICE